MRYASSRHFCASERAFAPLFPECVRERPTTALGNLAPGRDVIGRRRAAEGRHRCRRGCAGWLGGRALRRRPGGGVAVLANLALRRAAGPAARKRQRGEYQREDSEPGAMSPAPAVAVRR